MIHHLLLGLDSDTNTKNTQFQFQFRSRETQREYHLGLGEHYSWNGFSLTNGNRNDNSLNNSKLHVNTNTLLSSSSSLPDRHCYFSLSNNGKELTKEKEGDELSNRSSIGHRTASKNNANQPCGCSWNSTHEYHPSGVGVGVGYNAISSYALMQGFEHCCDHCFDPYQASNSAGSVFTHVTCSPSPLGKTGVNQRASASTCAANASPCVLASSVSVDLDLEPDPADTATPTNLNKSSSNSGYSNDGRGATNQNVYDQGEPIGSSTESQAKSQSTSQPDSQGEGESEDDGGAQQQHTRKSAQDRMDNAASKLYVVTRRKDYPGFEERRTVPLFFVFSQELIPDQQPLFAHLGVKGLTICTAKVAMYNFTNQLNHVTRQIEAMEEKDPESISDIDLSDVLSPSRRHHELSIWNGFEEGVVQGVIRELNIVTLQRFLEIGAIHYVDEKTAWSLVKNISESASRKCVRYSSRLTVFRKLFLSGLKSQVLYWTALFLVTSATEFWEYSKAVAYGIQQVPPRISISANTSTSQEQPLQQFQQLQQQQQQQQRQQQQFSQNVSEQRPSKSLYDTFPFYILSNPTSLARRVVDGAKVLGVAFLSFVPENQIYDQEEIVKLQSSLCSSLSMWPHYSSGQVPPSAKVTETSQLLPASTESSFPHDTQYSETSELQQLENQVGVGTGTGTGTDTGTDTGTGTGTGSRIGDTGTVSPMTFHAYQISLRSELVSRVGNHGKRIVIGWGLAALGAAIGALVHSGYGPTVGSMFLPTIGFSVLQTFGMF